MGNFFISLRKSFTPFTASVLASLLLFSCMTQTPSLNSPTPRQGFQIKSQTSSAHSLIPANTALVKGISPEVFSPVGFQVLSAPQPINCPSDYQYYGYACAQTGLVTALNASLGFFPVPPPHTCRRFCFFDFFGSLFTNC